MTGPGVIKQHTESRAAKAEQNGLQCQNLTGRLSQSVLGVESPLVRTFRFSHGVSLYMDALFIARSLVGSCLYCGDNFVLNPQQKEDRGLSTSERR